ncbi:hypothetical protein EJB05_02845, partial [Eragrostis curvula]
MRTCSFLRAIAVVVYAVASAAAAEISICPWRTVAHVDDPSVQNLGKWAVESAKAQAVGNCENNINRIYDLIIHASNGDYEAVVYVINRTEPQKVLSFKPVRS